MKPKHQRLMFLLVSLGMMTGGLAAILYAFKDNIVFFYTPSELIAKQAEPGFLPGRVLRIGGLVKKGSVINLAEGGIRFTITDLADDLTVTYTGLVPSLFREGQGVVAQGMLAGNGSFNAQTILAKHDETYMPREVVDALKASGRWQENGHYDAAPKKGKK